MEFTYENGVGFALLVFLYSTVTLIINLNSQLARNLKKIGQRISWSTFQPKPFDKEYIERPFYLKLLKIVLWLCLQLSWVLLSWLGIFFSACYMIYNWSKNSGLPNEVKVFRWKLRNIDMSFENIIKESEIAMGNDLTNLDEVIENAKAEMQDRGLMV